MKRTVWLFQLWHAPPTLAHYFTHFCNENKDIEFLVDGSLRTTFGETWSAASCVAHGLVSKHGVKKGDRIGIAARNSINWVIAYMGVVMAGGCATLLNGFWSGEELAYGIRLAECDLVLADSGRAKRLQGTEHSAKIVLFEHDAEPSIGLSDLWEQGDTAMKMLDQLGPDDLATILYTSGSTGQSKGHTLITGGLSAEFFTTFPRAQWRKFYLNQRRRCKCSAVRSHSNCSPISRYRRGPGFSPKFRHCSQTCSHAKVGRR